MPSKITNSLRVINANQFMSLFTTFTYSNWSELTSYSVGDVAISNQKKYVAIESGISGQQPPTHTTGIDDDGGIQWLFVENHFSTNYFLNKMYIGIGKTTSWRPWLVADAPDWITAAYSINDLVVDLTDSNNYYRAITDHSGEATVPSLDTTNWSLFSWMSAGSYIEGDIVEYNNGYYYCELTHSGVTDTPDIDGNNWSSVDNETPLMPENDFENMYKYLDNLITVKKLNGPDCQLAIERHNWEAGIIYDAFDPALDDFDYSAPFYAIVDDLGVKRIYKCLDNAGGTPSLNAPSSENIDFIRTDDGYLWKYMGRAGNDSLESFISSNYFPVVYKTFDDSLVNGNQWLVQQNAKKNSLGNIKVTNGGSGYDSSVTITVSAPDIGTDTATATAVLDGDVIQYIDITNVGSGYVNVPTITIGGNLPVTDATLEVVMAPKDGNGSNILKELDARYVIVQTEFDSDEGSFPYGDNYFPITGESDFRQVSLIIDPYDWNGDFCNSPYYIGFEHNDYIDQSLFDEFLSTTSYNQGDYVIYNNTHYICDVAHLGAWNSSNFTQLKEQLYTGSGSLLYIDNTEFVTRQDGQIEDIKIVLKF